MKNPPSRIVILLVWAAILVTILIAGSEPVSGQASKQVQSVGTLGDLKARRPVVREVIEVRNGSATNLWAAPRTFVHDPDATDAADDVYVVTNAAASGRYTATDRSTGIIDPRHFGAIGDGVTDDTAAFESALTAAIQWRGTNGGGKVYIPRGDYRVNLKWGASTNEESLVIEGDGPSASALLPVTDAQPVLWLAGRNITVRDLMIKGSYANPTGTGLRVGDTNQTFGTVVFGLFENIRVYDFDRGIQVDGADQTTFQSVVGWRCTNALFLNSRSHETSPNNNVVSKVKFLQCTFAQSYGDAAVKAIGGLTDQIEFDTCAIEQNEGAAVIFEQTSLFDGNPFRGIGFVNCYIEYNNWHKGAGVYYDIEFRQGTGFGVNTRYSASFRGNWFQNADTNHLNILFDNPGTFYVEGNDFITSNATNFFIADKAVVLTTDTSFKKINRVGYSSTINIPTLTGWNVQDLDDTYAQIAADSNGNLLFGPGGASPADIVAHRIAVGRLGIEGELRVRTNSTAGNSLSTAVVGESFPRLSILAGGRMEWRDGSSVDAIAFERAGAGVMQLNDGAFTVRRDLASEYALRVYKIGGDYRTSIRADGAVEFTDGTNMADVVILSKPYSATNQLTLDGTLRTRLILPADSALLAAVSGETFARFEIDGAGRMSWGDGTGARTHGSIERTALGELTLRTNIVVPGTITLGGVARASWPSGSGTNASTVYVDGTQVDSPNFVVSTEVDPSVAGGTNVSLALRDGSIGTNRVDANFHALLVAGGGGGDVTLAGTNLFTGPNTFGGATTISNLSVPGTMTVGSVSFGTPLGLSNGGTGGTNAETARTALGLAIGSDVQGWDEHLQQLATVGWASGDVPWFDGSNLTNLVTTAAGRALMTAANAAAQWAALQSSALQAGAYDAGTWDGVTDKAITPDQFRDVIAALPGGSNAVATVTPPLYLSNGVLTLDTDGLGGGAGGSGFVYILTNGVGAWQPQSASTNWPVISTTISSNDLPDATGKFIEGGYSCIMSNNSGTTATVFFDVLVGGVSVFRDSYTYNATAGYRPLASQFYLVRESSNTASLVQSGGHVASASTTTAGIGDFGASMIGALIVTTNIAVNWSTNLAFGVSLSSSTSVSTNDALGITVANAWMRRDATAGGGTGDVVGPSSSTDATLAVFMGTSGKVITNAPAIAATNVQTITAAVAAYEPLNANKYQSTNTHLTDLSDGTLTGSKVGTGITADNITAGTLSSNRLPAAVSFTTIDVGTINATAVVGDASGLTGINATNVTAGTLPDARLAATIARTNAPTLHSPTLLTPSLGVASATSLTLGATNMVPALAEKAPLASPALTGTPTVNSTTLRAAIDGKQATIGASTALTTGTLLVTSDLVQNSASIASSSGAAVVLDFKWPVSTFAATNNVIVLQSTNRPSAATNVVFSMLRITGDTVDRTISYPATWKRLGTNITTIPSNKVVLVSGMCIGTAESGVTFGVAKEE